MPNNNENKVLNVPHLRFPEFIGEWKETNLSSYAKKITKKNKGNVISNVLCNSANLGIIPQSDYFDRDIANNENTDTYYVIENGDFVYNPRKSVTAPYGPVNMYLGDKTGIISPLYLCFSVKDICCDFLLHWFKGNAWHRYVYSHGDTGVRFDRVSIKDDTFLNMPIKVPVFEEQIRISKLLRAIDERIATQNKIINKLQSLISGIIQNAIQKGLNDNTWEMIYLSKLLTERKEKNSNGYEVNSVSVSEGVINQIEYLGRSFAASDTSKYNVVRYGDIVYTKSPTGNFPYGIIKQSFQKHPVAVSPLYGVYEPYSNEAGCFLHYYFLSSIVTTNYLSPLIQKGAKNTINISNQTFLNNMVPYPKEEVGIRPIAALLRNVQIKLNIERLSLVLLEQQKTYLLRSMFI